MTELSIPSPLLGEVYQAIAGRRNVAVAQLDKISETEFLAALAYVLSAPLLDEADITDSLSQDCRAIIAAQELDVEGLLTYGFFPLTIKGGTLVAISSCPWDSAIAEIANSYFPQIETVRFVLASPKVMQVIGERLKESTSLNVPAPAGYQAGKAPVPEAGTTPSPESLHRADWVDVPAALPAGASGPKLALEDIIQLVNRLVADANELLQKRSGKVL